MLCGSLPPNSLQIVTNCAPPSRRSPQEHDEKAFMITDNVSEVHGQGFTYNTGTV